MKKALALALLVGCSSEPKPELFKVYLVSYPSPGEKITETYVDLVSMETDTVQQTLYLTDKHGTTRRVSSEGAQILVKYDR